MSGPYYVGVGASRAADAAEVLALVRAALTEVAVLAWARAPEPVPLPVPAPAAPGNDADAAGDGGPRDPSRDLPHPAYRRGDQRGPSTPGPGTGLRQEQSRDRSPAHPGAARPRVAPPPVPAAATATGPDGPDSGAGTGRDVPASGSGLPSHGALLVAVLATAAGKERSPSIAGAAARLGVEVVAFAPDTLARVAVPTPSEVALGTLGTPSVAEAAALLAAGPGAELALTKRKSAHATVAVAVRGPRRAVPSAAVPSAVPSAALSGAAAGPLAATPSPAPGAFRDRGPAPPGAPDVYPDGHDLRHHGDAEVGDGLVDLAVNVRQGTPPGWLVEVIGGTLSGLAAYPDGRAARHAVAARHGRADAEVLLTAGAAEAFVLLARVLRPRRAVVVHPQFTEPEAALRAAGHVVERVLLDASDGFRLHPGKVPADADLVVLGNPTNPTSVLHPAALVRELARPGRTLVVDEAFMDAVPGERESLAGAVGPDRAVGGAGAAGGAGTVPGLVVLRSLTKTWGLAGLRIGYVLAAEELIAQLAAAQPLWAVSSPALAAAGACVTASAVEEAARAARQVAADRAHLLARLREVPGVHVAGDAPAAPFVLLRTPGADRVRAALRESGYAVRRGDTFPGLGPDWLRVAVRDRRTTDGFVDALCAVLTSRPAR
ncbi:putative aminotransferase [Actinacidiphila reveromycinica]|uniref:Aminotransferase n=1 Tax=Actinacidiphila reveromycinica TaxID=659352 RepID=A0A7U3UPZ0_9ACTN|nr:Rv2231c family pyridoxal phosphate-dependent protein CobC [Streptomyces sp. SN-593]BBA96578.1 putative aminotransferase [Streptomyces sp. SN-593]